MERGRQTQSRIHKDRWYFKLFNEQWLMAVNPVFSTLCEMLTLAKGTHILGLTDTRSHGTISQDFFFLVATEKGRSQRVPIDNGRKHHTAIHINVSWEAIYTASVHSATLTRQLTGDSPKQNPKATKHFFSLIKYKTPNKGLRGREQGRIFFSNTCSNIYIKLLHPTKMFPHF